MKYSQLMLVLRRSHYCLTMLQAYYRGFRFPVRVVCLASVGRGEVQYTFGSSYMHAQRSAYTRLCSVAPGHAMQCRSVSWSMAPCIPKGKLF